MPSRRNMIAMTDEEAKEFIETGWTLQVASNGHNGFPHMVAMWYGVIDDKIHFTTYAKAQKVLNLKRDPRITVMLESGVEYSKIKGLVIEGEADVIENDPQLVMAVQDATGEKRNPNAQGRSTTPMDDEQRVRQASKRAVVRINPTRVYSWDHNKLGGVY
ncbi:MAG: pyridoxamine 5'-phosphate oxidase family protein [Chloroflexota bacterium]|nr:pyridoxamine 5'-phosphate oxidase family protein [Chloroflexota bacterium]MDE2893800.1 pyridoxamine 5'-phosphate oxidase family protein [Chloroflexota bacterium]